MEIGISYGGAALAGILSFFSPCVLPLVPFYLCYLAGISMEEFRTEGVFSNKLRKKLTLNTVFFSAGIIFVFMMMGLAASSLGQLFRQYRPELNIIAGAILTIFALHFLGLLKFSFFYREFRVESKISPTKFIGSFLMGLAFGFGWTPCVGPALATVLFIAADKNSLLHGALLLLTYGFFMTIPFILASFFTQPFLSIIQKNKKFMYYFEKSMGVFLLVFAFLIVSNNMSVISFWLLETFPSFTVIG